MRARIPSALRTGPLRASPAAASLSSSSSASTLAPLGTTATSTAAPIRAPITSSRAFSQQHCLRRPQTSPPSSTSATSSSSSSSSPSNSTTPTSVAGFLAWTPAEAVPGVAIHGFVRSVRTMKKYTFVTLGDGSSLASLQAVVPAALVAASDAELTNGAAVRLEGAWTPSPGAGQSHELHVAGFAVLGPSDAKTFPIQKKYQTPEFLRTLPHLRPRVPFNTTLLRFRSDVVSSLTRFFDERNFVQTHPPLITSSDCEGAGEVFTVVGGASPKQDNKQAGGSEGFFRADKYLTVSTQLHLEALSQAVGNVWTLSPTFRAEESDTPRHLSEFYMLEAEVGFVDRMDGVMDLVEDMLRFVATENCGSRAYDELLARTSTANAANAANAESDLEDPKTVEQRWTGLLSSKPWPRITYAEALRLLKDAPVEFEYAPVWEQGLMTEHERYLARIVGGAEGTPVFVTHYPRVSKAFYMLPTEGSSEGSGDETVNCFDLLVPEFCEIAGGSMREHRLEQLLATMQARGMAYSPGGLDWYVDLRRWGCPPHGGFGVGFDRLLCYLTGVQTIRDMVAFPRWFGRCDC
ncbi:asparaginyl-tRNA synthetase [Sporothrix bragantina]|uniref:asparagine--tRNA ligase n=1 Tax=Sporothrix bragantina TaxID=671064 RepID=A0ABP0ASL1_9PEZI